MSTNIVQTIGRKISEMRQAKGLNQGELALKLQKTKQAVSAWETGASQIPISELEKVANVLGVPIVFFFGDVEIAEIIGLQKLIPATRHFIGDTIKQYEIIQEKLVPRDLKESENYFYSNPSEPEIDLQNSQAKTHFWVAYDISENKQIRLGFTTTVQLQEGHFVNRPIPYDAQEDIL